MAAARKAARAVAASVQTDWLHRALNFFDHNRYTVGGISLAAAGTIWLSACTSQTVGLDGSKVDRAGLGRQVLNEERLFAAAEAEIQSAIAQYNANIEAHNQLVESAYTELDRKDAIKAQLVNVIGGQVTSLLSGTFNPATLATTGISLLGLLGGGGAMADNVRKGKVIRKMAAPATSPEPPKS